MNLLARAIGVYQARPALNRTVRRSQRGYRALTPRRERRPCPLAAQGVCSATGLAEARVLGMSALPGIVSRMSHCGGLDHDPDCN